MTSAGDKQERFGVTSEQHGHAAHLRPFGEIDIATAPVLDEWLRIAESNGNTAIVVDLERVTFMDVSGLRTFLGASQRASQSGRAFAITRAPSLVLRLLRITGSTHLLGADALALVPDSHPEEPVFSARAPAPHSEDVVIDVARVAN